MKGKALLLFTLLSITLLTPMMVDFRHAKARSNVIFEGRGIWVWATSFSPDPYIGPVQIHDAFKNFSELGFNFVLFLVKSSDGQIYYNSSIGPADPNYKWDPLKIAVEEAHRFGLELHAWFCVFRDIRLAKARPELAMVDINGKPSEEWVCPKNEEVRRYVKSLIAEVAFNYDIDGIHLDYIRYPNRTYCYCNNCRENWISEHLDIPWPPEPTNPEWIRMRQNAISSFVEETRLMLKGINPKIKLSAAVYPVVKDAINNRMQNYPEWGEKGIVDFITPMTYTNNTSQFQEWLEEIVEAVKCKVLVYVGIGLYKLLETQNPNEILKNLINATRMEKYTCNCFITRIDGQVMFRYGFLGPFSETLKEAYAHHAKTSHSEEIPPEIGEIYLEPLEAGSYQSVIIVNVADHQTRVRNVTLWYRTDNGFLWLTVMKRVCQNTYRTTLPCYKNCTWIHYKIEAFDIVGNKATKEDCYHIPEFPTAAFALLFGVLSAMDLALNRKKIFQIKWRG